MIDQDRDGLLSRDEVCTKSSRQENLFGSSRADYLFSVAQSQILYISPPSIFCGKDNCRSSSTSSWVNINT